MHIEIFIACRNAEDGPRDKQVGIIHFFRGPKHSRRHILGAEELARWMRSQTQIFGTAEISKKKVTSLYFKGKKGIIFIMNGWGPGDHLDLWDGSRFKGGESEYFARGEQVWFWELS